MLKIGEFSKLAHLTVKTLRYYEREGLIVPETTDEWTGYRYYETGQLELASKIKSLRQIGLTIDEVKEILKGKDACSILTARAEALSREREQIDSQLSRIHYILEEKEMKYHVTEKTIPAQIVYYSETVLKNYSDLMSWIPKLGEECLKLNPDMKCAVPEYEFCEYLDAEYKESDIRVRHNEAVTKKGIENDNIRFREIPETKVISIMHKGPYENLPQAYAYIMKYAEDNGYKCAGLIRECYIDGIWNNESEEDWLTEVQLPIE